MPSRRIPPSTPSRRSSRFLSRKDIEHGAAFVRECIKPAAMLWIGGCSDDRAFGPKDLVAAGVPVYRNALPCLRAVRAAADFGAFVARRRAGADIPVRAGGADRRGRAAGARGAPAQADGARGQAGAVRLRLSGHAREPGPQAPTRPWRTRASLGGRVALKIDSPDIQHKTEAGAIRLGLQGDDAVRQGYADVVAAAQRHAPAAKVNGVLVQEMAPPGTEMMLGIVRDPVFGPVVAAGLGGIHVEVLRDIAYRIAPVTPDEAGKMLRELRGYKVLEGVRGAKPADIDALVAAIVRLSWLAHDLAGRDRRAGHQSAARLRARRGREGGRRAPRPR